MSPAASNPAAPPEAGARMPLMEHLKELRTRLIRCLIAIAVLGVLSLAFSREIFGALMKPVLDALPPDQRSLIYTSGIEEINVLMKVGVYAGIFFSTPVVLWQIWGFIAPGLFPHERRYATPFVLAGSLAFIIGTAFCYFVLLPTMFTFLLNGGDNQELQDRVHLAESSEREVIRYARLGELTLAAQLAKETSSALSAKGDGQVSYQENAWPDRGSEVYDRLEGLGRLVDALHDGVPNSGPVLRRVMQKRLEALKAQDSVKQGKVSSEAVGIIDQASSSLAGAGAETVAEVGALWQLERHLAAAKARYQSKAWTRPLLSMTEQLTLVLVLELALGAIFELPLVMAVLASLGFIKASWLMKYQRHAFVVCLIVAAIITPTGDPVNLAVMTGPMVLCYELGVLAAYLIEKRRARRNSALAIK